MKVQASIKRRCKDCQVIVRRSGKGKPKRLVICSEPRHKQRQG